MAENSREIVLDSLLELEREQVFSHKLVKAVLDKYDYLDAKEKRFIKRLIEGCIERRIELDYVISLYSSVRVNKMKPLIRQLMRMSVYQILYMDAVPDSAVCNEAVKLAAKRKFVGLKGFVNGVLRKIAASKDSISYPKKEEDALKYMHIRYSMPEWIVKLWIEQYGEEDAEKILEGLLQIHPVTIRFGQAVADSQVQACIEEWTAKGVTVSKIPELSYAYALEGVEGVAGLRGFGEGLFTVQDVSSMLAVENAGIKEGDFVMDICAAPGGKTMLAAGKAGKVLSRDVSEAKVALIEENVVRMGLTDKVTCQVYDATKTDEAYVEKADVVIMDVPCSGLGVIGKKRDIKYNVSPESLESLVELQREIVDSSWKYVKKGGILQYSTCTIHAAENEEMVEWICANYPFRLEKKEQILPGFTKADGFFYARLVRNE